MCKMLIVDLLAEKKNAGGISLKPKYPIIFLDSLNCLDCRKQLQNHVSDMDLAWSRQ